MRSDGIRPLSVFANLLMVPRFNVRCSDYSLLYTHFGLHVSCTIWHHTEGQYSERWVPIRMCHHVCTLIIKLHSFGRCCQRSSCIAILTATSSFALRCHTSQSHQLLGDRHPLTITWSTAQWHHLLCLQPHPQCFPVLCCCARKWWRIISKVVQNLWCLAISQYSWLAHNA